MKTQTIIITSVATFGFAALAGFCQAAEPESPTPPLRPAAISAAPARPSRPAIATPAPSPPAVAAFAAAAETYSATVTGSGGGGGIGFSSAGSATGPTLIIPKEAGDAASFSEAEEDLKVMAHILQKAARGNDDKGRQAMGIAIWHSPTDGAGAPRNLYIEGYGALFFLNVNSPLLPPPARYAGAEDGENTSNDWEEARRELHQPAATDFQFHLADGLTPEGGEEKYDADKVNELKQNLITALKNAAHIRKLTSDETVTVIVNGSRANSRTPLLTTSKGANAFTYVARSGKRAGDARGAKLILRARKSDIEAFQKGKTDLDDFRKQVTAIIY